MAEFIKKIATSQGEKQIDFQSLGNFPICQPGQTLKVIAVDENGRPTAWEGGLSGAAIEDIGNLHVWKRELELEAEILPGYTLGTAQQTVLLDTVTSTSSYISAEYASTISVNDNGDITFNNKSSGSQKYSSWTFSNWVGKFVRITGDDGGPISDPKLYYFPAGTTFSRTSPNFIASSAQLVTPHGRTPAVVETVYPTSDNPASYPEDGYDGEYYYKYLGSLAGLAGNSARIETGYYYGTGTVPTTEAEALELTFDAPVKFLWILGSIETPSYSDGEYLYPHIIAPTNTHYSSAPFYMQGLDGIGMANSADAHGYSGFVWARSLDGKTLKRYATSADVGALTLFNTSGKKYIYIALL